MRRRARRWRWARYWRSSPTVRRLASQSPPPDPPAIAPETRARGRPRRSRRTEAPDGSRAPMERRRVRVAAPTRRRLSRRGYRHHHLLRGPPPALPPGPPPAPAPAPETAARDTAPGGRRGAVPGRACCRLWCAGSSTSTASTIGRHRGQRRVVAASPGPDVESVIRASARSAPTEAGAASPPAAAVPDPQAVGTPTPGAHPRALFVPGASSFQRRSAGCGDHRPAHGSPPRPRRHTC